MPVAFSTIRTRVERLVGSNVALSAAELSDIVKAEHETILNDNSWADRKAVGTLSTVAVYGVGTVSTVGTTVLGSGTTFTASMVGRWLRLADEFQHFQITAYTSPTELTIESAVPSGDVTGVTYTIFQNVYSLPANCERVVSMVYQDRITDVPIQDIDRLDPYRQTSDIGPRHFVYRELTSDGVRQVELWPVPSAAILIRLSYLKTNTLTNDNDAPLYRSDVLVWKAAASCAYLLYAKSGDTAWSDLADRYMQQYDKSLLGARQDDLGKNSPAHKIRDVVYDPLRGGPYYDRDPWS